MSYAASHPVRCLRAEDMGCTEQFPGSRHDAIEASRRGWYFPRQRDDRRGYCPRHVPAWVAAWREARQQLG